MQSWCTGRLWFANAVLQLLVPSAFWGLSVLKPDFELSVCVLVCQIGLKVCVQPKRATKPFSHFVAFFALRCDS